MTKKKSKSKSKMKKIRTGKEYTIWENSEGVKYRRYHNTGKFVEHKKGK